MADDKMPMMACGHRANSFRVLAGGVRKPACVICAGIGDGAEEREATEPDLSQRRARCGHYGQKTYKNECDVCAKTDDKVCRCERPSNTEHLAFFEYRGPGSRFEKVCKHCGRSGDSHPSQGGSGLYNNSTKTNIGICENQGKGLKYEPFGPGGMPFDEFYCGCHSWD